MTWPSTNNANRLIDTYVKGIVDVSGDLIVRNNDSIYSNNDIEVPCINYYDNTQKYTNANNLNYNSDPIFVDLLSKITGTSTTTKPSVIGVSATGQFMSCLTSKGYTTNSANGTGITNTPKFIYSVDYGNTWKTSTQPTTLYDIACYYGKMVTSSNGKYHFYISKNTNQADYNRLIFLSSDYGATFNSIATLSGTNNTATIIDSCISYDGKYIFFLMSAGSNGYLYLSNDYGVNFSNIATNVFSTSIYPLSMCCSKNGKYIYIYSLNTSGGTTRYIYYSTDYGSTFASKQINSTSHTQTAINSNSIMCSYSGDVIVILSNNAASYNEIWYSTNYSSTVTKSNISLSSSGNYYIAISANGQNWFITYDALVSSNNINYISCNYGNTLNSFTITTNSSYALINPVVTADFKYLFCSYTGLSTATFILKGVLPYYDLYYLNVYAKGGTCTTKNTTSDYRIKNNITNLESIYNVDYLTPVIYENKLTNKKEIGLIAHEVQNIYPFLVNGKKDGVIYQTLNYDGIIGILIKEIQELKKRLKDVKKLIL